MKAIVFALLLLSATSYADSITCKLTSGGAVVITFDDASRRGVSAIDYQHDAKTERIYSRWPMVRGETTVDYCNPNDNEYQDFDGSYSIDSTCNAPSGQVTFDARFSVKNGGKISFVKADLVTDQDLVFSSCQ